MSIKFHSGFVTIIGKPNVGKSTLLNFLLSEKVAIVSSKPETTRDKILGILTTDNLQAAFIDTPGIHKPHLLLGKLMVKRALSSLLDADLILFIVDVKKGFREEDKLILDMIKESKKPAILLMNKIDSAKKSAILPLIDTLSKSHNFIDFIPISALNGDNIELLKEKIYDNLPVDVKHFPDNEITDKSEIFQTSEIIREKILALTQQEVPHSIAVKIDRFEYIKEKDHLEIEATIYVERDSQKGILIGQKGKMAKQVSTLSRKELKAKFNKQVILTTWVKVLKNWRKDERALRLLGIGDSDG